MISAGVEYAGETRVRLGGELSDRKGLNRQGGGISAPAISEKDREDIRFAAEEQVDYLAVSFARDAADIEQARTLIRQAGGDARIVARGNRQILAAAVAVMDQIADVVATALVDRLVQGVEDEVRPERRRHAPADDAPREHVDHQGDVDEPAPRRDIRKSATQS